MAFSPVDIPIQEMLQTDFIVDLAQIHNTNVLLLKDKLEDLLNNFEIDLTSISIGTDNPINSIKTTDIIIQDGGFVFQTGTPTEIIARLSKNIDDQSVLNVDILSVDVNMSIAEASINTLLVSGESEFNSISVGGALSYTSALVESKERVTINVNRNTLGDLTKAVGTLNLTSSSKRNIFITLRLNEAVGNEQVWDGSQILSAIDELIVKLDFDKNNPPAENQLFTIYVEDVISTTSGSVISVINLSNGSIPTTGTLFISLAGGVNQSTYTDIILHYDLAAMPETLSINVSNDGILPYKSNVTLNYIVDKNSDDRLIITSREGFSIL
jgi:hypothetical protein